MSDIIKFSLYPFVYLLKIIAAAASLMWLGACILVAIPFAIIGCFPAGLLVITYYLEKLLGLEPANKPENTQEDENKTTENDIL